MTYSVYQNTKSSLLNEQEPSYVEHRSKSQSLAAQDQKKKASQSQGKLMKKDNKK